MAKFTSPLSISLLALAVSASLAQAADMPAEAPLYSAAPAANWSGFYAGTLIGYGWSQFDVDGADVDVDGTTGGAVISYNWQSGSFVYGLEGDITLHEIRGEDDGVLLGGVEVDTLYSAHLRARLGYDLGWAMPFIAGGFAANESYVRDAATGFDGDNQRLFGWTIGAGVDVSLGETFIGPVVLRAEYLYEDLSSETFAVGGGLDVEQQTHFFRGAIISKLGSGDGTGLFGSSGDWNGAYGGLMVGYGRATVETSADGFDDEDFEADGALGGIYTGRNFQFGNVVLGFDGTILLTNFEGSGDQALSAGETDFRNYIQGDARGRVGYAFGDVLPFIAGGVSWTRSEQEDADGAQRGRVPSVNWTVGGGVDYRVSERVSVRGEYLYARSFDSSSPDFGGDTDQDLEFHEVRFGTAYHF